MTDYNAGIMRRLAVDLIRQITDAPRWALDSTAGYLENLWIDRAIGDRPSDDAWSDMRAEQSLAIVRVIRSARRMRELELREMADAMVSA